MNCSPLPSANRCGRFFSRLATVSFLLGILASVELRALSAEGLTTNGRSNPLGIGLEEISFAWQLASEERGAVQTAFQIEVGTSAESSDVWNSGRVTSSEQVDIALPGTVVLRPGTRYYWRVKAWDGRDGASEWSTPAWFETGITSEEWSPAQWIRATTAAPSSAAHPSLPLFRKKFTVHKPIKTARLYASARGIYEASLNGEKVGNQFLAPGWTDYIRRIQSQTYDVTPMLREGENVLGAALGDGWYRGKVGIGWHGIYGDTLALLAKLRLTYVDGSVEEIVTDSSWLTGAGPFVRADLQDGEDYDARLEPRGWNQPNFNASHWVPAAGAWGDTSNLVPQPDDPVRQTETRVAVRHSEPRPGAHVYDLGQNLVGVARIKLTGKAGQTVRLRYAEELQRNGPERGRLYTENFRSAKVTDTYTFARDESVVYQPTFTQHGFRYIEVTGVDSPPAVQDVQAAVLGSDLPNTGDLRVSHPMLDRLVQNIRWGQRSNFLSIPTDTPARDERLGWTGDIAVFAPTAARFQDTRAFLSKWMDDLRDAQRADGNIPAVVPQPRDYFNATGVGWSDAFIAVPYAVWRATGDTRILRRNWDAMQRFYRFTHASATRDGNLIEEGRSSWFSGDWLNLENVDRVAEHRVIATAYFAENTRMMAEMARALGHTALADDWAALVPKISAAFCAAFRRADGRLELGTQTVYALALGIQLIADPSERAETAARFVEKLASDNFHLKTGFLGTPWLLPALSRIGRQDLAARLLLNEDFPSWGFEVRMGATTMWERWDSIRPDGSFGPVDMNSFNHYAYGAVGDWMFQHVGGLEIVEAGYKRFRVAPLAEVAALGQARCQIHSSYGLIRCEWKKTAQAFHLSLVVPVNTSAEVILPVDDLRAIQEGQTPLTQTKGIAVGKIEARRVHLNVGSGRYEFAVPRRD